MAYSLFTCPLSNQLNSSLDKAEKQFAGCSINKRNENNTKQTKYILLKSD